MVSYRIAQYINYSEYSNFGKCKRCSRNLVRSPRPKGVHAPRKGKTPFMTFHNSVKFAKELHFSEPSFQSIWLSASKCATERSLHFDPPEQAFRSHCSIGQGNQRYQASQVSLARHAAGAVPSES